MRSTPSENGSAARGEDTGTQSAASDDEHFEEVALPHPQPRQEPEDGDEDEDGDEHEQFEEVAAPGHEHQQEYEHGEYASLYAEPSACDGDATTSSAVPAEPRIFHDGKGQAAGVSIELPAARRRKTVEEKRDEEEKRRRREATITPQDRANRIAAHKLHVLALLTWAKKRNATLQDDVLQGWLAESAPPELVQQLKRIKPRLEPNQRERVRMFEAFLARLTDWWKRKFVLNPYETAGAALRQPDRDLVTAGGLTWNRPGRRVDGWLYESPGDRVERHKDQAELLRRWKEAVEQRRSRKKPRQALPPRPRLPPEITLFPPGSATTKIPAYLRLAPPPERAHTAEQLLTHAVGMNGSRETSASLFVALCRSLGIPARLVISPQVGPWSVSAAKVATSTAGGSVGSTTRIATFGASAREQSVKRGYAHLRPKRGTDSDNSATLLSEANDSSLSSPAPHRLARTHLDAASRTESAKGKAKGNDKTNAVPISDNDSPSEASDPRKALVAERAELPGRKRPIKPKVKLRPHRPRMKASASASQDEQEGELDPVNLSHPPTVWAEVFSKPFQRWLTVDPIRGFVVATGNRSMEPQVHDRDNKLVYVVAYEEDGYARDVTARYTRTLHSRVAKMRPPAGPGLGGNESASDWWDKVVEAISRPSKLDRDLVEDEELEAMASREPMPTSVAAFKDHPVFVLERHIKRDQVIHPLIKAGMVGHEPVYLRKHVLQLKNARGWMQQGRAVKPDEIPLKFIKTRAYTIEHKRAQVAAEMEGREEQDPLFAFSQTEPYRAPPVVDGRVPKNQYGRLDLFVPSMLPPGGAHVNHPRAARAAQRQGVHYAEAVTGFEFRKFRGTPKISGIVVPVEHATEVEEECRVQDELEQLKSERRKEERVLKLWRRLINAVQISARVRAEFDQTKPQVSSKEGKRQLRALQEDAASNNDSHSSGDEDDEGGGFFVGTRPEPSGANRPASSAQTPLPIGALVQKYGQDVSKVVPSGQAGTIRQRADEAVFGEEGVEDNAVAPAGDASETTPHEPANERFTASRLEAETGAPHTPELGSASPVPFDMDSRIATISELAPQAPKPASSVASSPDESQTVAERGHRRINLRVRRTQPTHVPAPTATRSTRPTRATRPVRRTPRKRKAPSEDEASGDEEGTTSAPAAPRRSSRRLAARTPQYDEDAMDALIDQLE